MASTGMFSLTLNRSFRAIRPFQQRYMEIKSCLYRKTFLKPSLRGFGTFAPNKIFRSRKFYNVGTVTAGTSLGFLGFFKKEEELSEHDQVRRMVSEGLVSKQKRDVVAATSKFHSALDLSTDFYHQNKITEKEHLNHRVFIYDMMANLSLEVGNFKQAEELFIETMKLALQLGMKENDNAMIEMALKVAIIHTQTNRLQLADQGFKFCISEQEKKLQAEGKPVNDGQVLILDPERDRSTEQNTKILLGKAYQHFAHTFMRKRDFKHAVEYSSKALGIASESLGPTDETTFVLMNDLATCQILLEQYDEAEKVLKDGIKKSRHLDSVIESAMCSNLGALYIRMKRLDEAESTCKRGLKVAEKHYDSFMMGPCQLCLKKLAEVRGESSPDDDDDDDDDEISHKEGEK